MNRRRFSIIALLLTVALLAGCSTVDINVEAEDEAAKTTDTVSDDTDDADESDNEDDAKSDADDDEWVGLNGEKGSADTDNGREVLEELDDIEEDLTSLKYNGFLVEEFSSPEDIPWIQVFYLGAGITTDEFSNIESELMDMYSEETGDEVREYGGINIFKAEDVKDFIKGTSGLDITEVKRPLGMTYYDEWDIYVSTGATDSNQVGVKVLSAYEKDGVYTVNYESFGSPMQVKMKRNGDYWEFISNLWNPDEDREKAIEELYDEVLENYRSAVIENWDSDQCRNNQVNDYVTIYANSDDPFSEMGYCKRDIDGDGTDELLIGEIAGGTNPDYIFAAYTVKRGECNNIFDMNGGDRDRFYIAEDNTIYEEASSGAADSSMTHYEAISSFTYINLVPEDGIIYSEDGSGGKDKPYYYAERFDVNVSSNWEQISEAEYNDYMDDAQASYEKLGLKAFSSI